MAKMMVAFSKADTKNTIALPQMLESSAVMSAPVDFIRILETGGLLTL